MYRLLLLSLLAIIVHSAAAQRGGEAAFAYLKLPSSPRIAALGGRAPGYGGEKELSFAVSNPAFATQSLHNALEVSVNTLFADTKYSTATYFYAVDSALTFGAHLRQMWYGSFERRDPQGLQDGTFAAHEMALGLQASYRLAGGWSIGASITPLYSLLERYWSFGVATNLGLGYSDPEGLFSAGLVMQNLGTTLKTYSGKQESTPFELLGGVKIRTRHAPLVFLFTLQHLENWERRFLREKAYKPAREDGVNPKDKGSLGNDIATELLAHPVIGIEFHPSRYFFAQVSYNHARRMEMLIPNHYSTEGFAWGFGVQVQRVAVRFSRSLYHSAGATNHFSLAIYFSGGRDAAMRTYRPVKEQKPTPIEGESTEEELDQ